MKFNGELNFDTSSVITMARMFKARALAPNLQPSPSLRAASSTTAPTALSPPGQYPDLSLATRQKAKKFNQPLNFDTAKVTSMKGMFLVRALGPNLQPSPSLRAACTTTAPTVLSPPSPHLTPLCMTLRLGRTR